MRVSDLHIDRIYINKQYRSSDYTMSRNHYHYYYEIFYVAQGACRFFIDNHLYELRGGDFLIIPPHTIHYNRYLTGCTRYNIYFRTSDLEQFLRGFDMEKEQLLSLLSQTHFYHVHEAYREMFLNHLETMVQEDKVDDQHTPLLLQLQLHQFFLYSHRCCSLRDQSGRGVADDPILDASHYISEHYSQNITLDLLASRACLSPGYFSKRFHQVTGVGMKEYLNYVRLDHAARELLSTSHSITEVAANSGYADSNYFKDAFKKMYGVSPRAYRKNRTTDHVTAGSVERYEKEQPARTERAET